jgi:hypothetical protein
VAAEAREAFLRAPPVTAPRLPSAGPSRSRLVEERNARAREHRDAVVRYEHGHTSIREVELAEMRLLDARVELQEIDVATWRRGRIVLLDRDAERARHLFEAGRIAAGEADQASLSAERERFLAGDVNDYAIRRRRFLDATKDRHRHLVDAGHASAKTLAEDYARLEAAYPDIRDLRDAGAR